MRVLVIGTLVFLSIAQPCRGIDAVSTDGGVLPGTEGKLPPPPSRSERLRLVILPDRTTGRDWGMPYLHLAVEDVTRIRPDAVITIGDMVQGYTRSVEQWTREADEYLEIVGRLKLPFYPLPGNHEVVSGTRSPEDTRFYELYKETFGPLYYAIEFDLASAVLLLSDDPEVEGGVGIGSVQHAWLMATLDQLKQRGRPIFVLFHRPLWRGRDTGWWETVHPMLVAAGVRAVIAGHFHALQRDPDVDGVEYHIVGTCGGMIDQYPFAGQLQHLTFLNVDDSGAFHIFHQPVGVTLPDDFVLKPDQDRVFRLKTRDELVHFDEAVRDPLHGEVDARVPVTMQNPIDVPITVTASLIRKRPDTRRVGGTFWLSRMEGDRFNPFVTDINTPFVLAEEMPPVVLQPGESRTAFLAIRCARQDESVPPPEFHFEAVFSDSQEREVPVIVRRRLPIQREATLSASSPTLQWPLAAWDFTVYDFAEPSPWVELSRLGGGIELIITTQDGVKSAFNAAPAMTMESIADPQSDAVLIDARQDGRHRIWYMEPFVGESSAATFTNGVIGPPTATMGPHVPNEPQTGWGVVVRLPEDVWDGFDFERPIMLNIGVADNDETYHTQWRWLAPKEYPLHLHVR